MSACCPYRREVSASSKRGMTERLYGGRGPAEIETNNWFAPIGELQEAPGREAHGCQVPDGAKT